MDSQYGDARYHSRFVEDRKAGFASYRLVRTRFGESKDVAQVTFWDAAGQFWFTPEGRLDLVRFAEQASR